MDSKTKYFRFQKTYGFASMIEECVTKSESLSEIPWDFPEVVQSLYRCSKISLLHRYIYAMISVEEAQEYRHNSDIYEEEDAKGLEEILKTYGVQVLPYEKFDSSIPCNSGDIDDPFYRWFRSQEEKFEEYWEIVTDEVFHLLFANRTFLLSFNQALARNLSANEASSKRIPIPSQFCDAKGRIKRLTYLPPWLRKAVYCRDHGRCVLCQKDLSGLLSTDRQIHYDHIVPLSLWGTNDPANFQLLCDECNLHKGGASLATNFLYPSWWD